ncbi:M48 family metalloprotease [Blastopirellula marina]|uniref:M48 family metalloprotease n=1 Tax=Blastopirellula marina TaxID=124 RepID=UPI0013048EB2|nr:M48 family metalloprotease [Blastopirellula marina]
MSEFAFISLLMEGSGFWGLSPFAAMIIPLLAVMVYPVLARMLFPLQKLSEHQSQELSESLPTDDKAFMARLRVCDTGERICNAAVVGCLPGFSFVLVSDALFTRLSPQGVAAIVAHEMGHLKLWHVPLRLCIVFAGGVLGLALVHQAEGLAAWQTAAQVAATLATAGYMGLMLHLVAPLLEFHADAYAIDALSSKSGDRRQAVRELTKALSQLTLLSGLRPDQKTWLYPSFEERRQAILGQQSSPSFRHRLQRLLAVIFLSQLMLIAVGIMVVAR